MRHNLIAFAAVSTLAMLQASGQLAAQARPAGSRAAKTAVPRTPWGDPDLQGIWTNMTEAGTPLERPNEIAEKDASDPEVFQRVIKEREETRKQRARENEVRPADIVGNNPPHWFESNAPKNSRLWWVVDPPDGKVPALTASTQARVGAVAEGRRGIGADEPRPGHWVEDLSTFVRCITRGLPSVYIPLAYNQNFQIVQSAGYVTILYEMIHETRVIPLDGRPHVPSSVRQWLGDSRGRWDGATLVVDVTNFSDKTYFKAGIAENRYLKGLDENLHLVERFTRVDQDTINWEVTIDDPTAYAKPWSFAIPLTRDDSQQWIFEYACHEGNYGLNHILRGARAKEKTERQADGQP